MLLPFQLRMLLESLLKPDKELSVHFDNIHFETQERKIILRALQQKAYLAEQRGKIFFTYQSLCHTLLILQSSRTAMNILQNIEPRTFYRNHSKDYKKGVKTVTVSDIVALAH